MSNERTLISILLPMRNASLWIAECLDSILIQSAKNWELIIVNDHSTDDSEKIVRLYDDPRISLYQNDGNGIINAMRMALEKSSGEYITRMDADDIMPEHKLELLLSLASLRQDTVATGKVRYFGDTHISEGYLEYEQWLNARNRDTDHWKWIYRECAVASANWMTHRTNVDFERNLYPEDYDLVINWYSKNLNISTIEEITHLWREHPDRTSRNSEHYEQKAFFELKIGWFLDLDFDKTKPLILLGKNKKQELTSRILKKYGVSHNVLTAENLHLIEKIINPQVLICVYPELKLRNELLGFLANNRLEMGLNFWFL